MTFLAAGEDMAGLNPFQALRHLGNVVQSLDYVLDDPGQKETLQPVRRRLVYARNTLCLALNLWQDDVQRRLNRSRGSFYVYCMTDAERLAFLRRIRPALEFTAEELRAIGIMSINHLVPLLEQAAAEAVIYAAENRNALHCARTELAPGQICVLPERALLPLPPLPEKAA
ncbi:MAG: hypothetical protein HYU57_07740 [Micavibrio aeruginosavorus]|nr:hypothetical protein [Micavibrio aeruginosavorus]